MSINSIDALYAEHKKFGRYVTRQRAWYGIKLYGSWKPINPAFYFAVLAVLVMVGTAGITLKHHSPSSAYSSASNSHLLDNSPKSSSSLHAQSPLPTTKEPIPTSGAPSLQPASHLPVISQPAATYSFTISCDQLPKQQATGGYNFGGLNLGSLVHGNAAGPMDSISQIPANYRAELQSISCPL